ncbi:hypothetical protein D3C75_1208320 [compost metagenome]
MGRMARPSLIAQALTPLVGGYLLQVADASSVLLGVCALALFNVLLVLVLARRVTPAVAIRTDRRTP